MIDRVKITLVSGKGGDGAICFRHEKSVEFGGPSGGNGGKGGSIYIVADEGINSLSAYRFGKTIRAQDGENGKAKLCYGKDADDIFLRVPVGTVAMTLDGQIIADLYHNGDKALLVKGGRGGRGNACFKTPLKRTPKIAENGLPGQSLTLYLELKLLADVGLVGLPNVGKSTFLSNHTRADAQIANYPFTTLEPQLGVCFVGVDKRFVIADLPGLISGASQGKGLGLTFLRHIDRCSVLLHILDATSNTLFEDFKSINHEMFSYKPSLSDKVMVVALNKIDEVTDRTLIDKFHKIFDAQFDIFEISAKNKINTKKLINKLYSVITKENKKSTRSLENDEFVYKINSSIAGEIPDYQIEKLDDHLFKIVGDRVIRTKRLINLKTDEGVDKLLKYLDKIGVDSKLYEAGARNGDTVLLDDFEFEYFE